jgi:histidinol-phosphate aminotransferase
VTPEIPLAGNAGGKAADVRPEDRGTAHAIPPGFFRESIAELVPYEPGKPVEEVQRELGLERVVKLASNEGPFPPFPAALDAIDRTERELNRYPDGGAFALRSALAERHGVAFEEVVVGGGADGVIDLLSQATLEPGDEIVCGWPSFPSYVLDALKLGAVPQKVPLRSHVYDLDAMLDAIGPRTKLVYVCHPNNPTGTANGRDELLAFLDALPGHVLAVLDQAYFEYIDDPDYADGVQEAFKAGRPVVVLRTFSKIYGLAGLRVGYGVAPAAVVTATSKVRRAFDVTATAQAAALASLDDPGEIARRRELNREGRERLAALMRERGLEPVEPSLGNFLFADVGDGRDLFERLLREGVIVRPLTGFGAPEAIRVSVGTPEENELFGVALGHVLSGVS